MKLWLLTGSWVAFTCLPRTICARASAGSTDCPAGLHFNAGLDGCVGCPPRPAETERDTDWDLKLNVHLDCCRKHPASCGDSSASGVATTSTTTTTTTQPNTVQNVSSNASGVSSNNTSNFGNTANNGFTSFSMLLKTFVAFISGLGAAVLIAGVAVAVCVRLDLPKRLRRYLTNHPVQYSMALSEDVESARPPQLARPLPRVPRTNQPPVPENNPIGAANREDGGVAEHAGTDSTYDVTEVNNLVRTDQLHPPPTYAGGESNGTVASAT